MASCSETRVHIVSDKVATFLGFTAAWSIKMPVAGLSIVLENMVMSVMKTHCLKTWNLFHEENGNLTFRLKFELNQESHIDQYCESPSTDSHRTVSFKKKNAKQISRDKARSRKRRRIRQSVSSIETNRKQQTPGSQSDMDITCVSNSGLQIDSEDILETTPLFCVTSSPGLAELSESESELDLRSVVITEASIEVPTTPVFSEPNQSEESISDEDSKADSSSESEFTSCDTDDERLSALKLLTKISNDFIKGVDEFLSPDNDSDT